MAIKITIHKGINEDDFSVLSRKWEDSFSAKIECKKMDLESKKNIFNMALNKIPNSFSEAVIDIFIEDDDFPVNDSSLIKCILEGTVGLKKSVLYRKDTPKYIRDLYFKKNSI